MSYSCGIVGLANVGKSTLFNAISRSSVPAEDFPFCTIDPNQGRIRVNDPRLNTLSEMLQPQSTVPLYLPIVDIAGLVRNASKGEGLGNRFLAHIRETDVLLHTVRCFTSSGDSAQAVASDPIADIEIIDTELILSDLEVLQKMQEKLLRDRKSKKRDGDPLIQTRKRIIDSVLAHLEKGESARTFECPDEAEYSILKSLNLISAKPVMFVCNIDDSDSISGNPLVEMLESHSVAKYGSGVAPVCAVSARIEAEIAELPEADQTVFIAELGWQESGLDRIVRCANGLLRRLCFFTAGDKEVRAWSAPSGSSARACAGRIHTDFARGFIAAEVVSYDNFIACTGWKQARERGQVSLEGADYPVQDGDIINFRFNV